MARVVDLAGGPHEIGLQHGRALRAEIAEALGIYTVALGRDESVLRGEADRIARDLHDRLPELAVEIEGIAEGAGVEPWRIFVLNARSELMSGADGCTAVFVPESGLLGQTWDWIEQLEALFVVLRIERPDGHRILTVTEPGMVGKIGLGSAGIGCTLNFLYSPGPHRGTPVHALLRSVLEASDLEDARRRLDAALPGQSGNVLVGSASGDGFDVELAGLTRRTEPLGGATFAHTNHYLWSDISTGPLIANSHARFDRASSRVAGEAPKRLDELAALLSDTADATHPICAPYRPKPWMKTGMEIGTVCTVLMELGEGRMHVRRGPDPAAAFETLTLDGSSGAA